MNPIAAGVRVTGRARADLAGILAERYESGESIRGIASSLGRSYGFVQQLLIELDVPLRTRGGDTRSPAARQRLEAAAERLAVADSATAAEPGPSGGGKAGKKSKHRKPKHAKAKPGKDKGSKPQEAAGKAAKGTKHGKADKTKKSAKVKDRKRK